MLEEGTLSWAATSWAKTTRGHRGRSEKLVLMVLADYYDDSRGYAHPSHATLSDDCEMPVRTVQWALKRLQEDGFVIRLQKGNQFQPSKWALNMESESAILSKVNPQYEAGEPATSATVNPQRVAVSSDQATLSLTPSEVPLDVPPHTPPLNSPPTSPDPSPTSMVWLEQLRDLERWDKFGRPFEASLLKWVKTGNGKKFSDEQLLASAIGLGTVSEKTMKGYGRLTLAFQRRLNMGYDDPGQNIQPSENGTKPMTQHEKILADKARWDA